MIKHPEPVSDRHESVRLLYAIPDRKKRSSPASGPSPSPLKNRPLFFLRARTVDHFLFNWQKQIGAVWHQLIETWRIRLWGDLKLFRGSSPLNRLVAASSSGQETTSQYHSLLLAEKKDSLKTAQKALEWRDDEERVFEKGFFRLPKVWSDRNDRRKFGTGTGWLIRGSDRFQTSVK